MICITCGTQFSPPGRCPECNWDTDATHDAESLVTPGEVLAARYSIQKKLGSGRLGVCFKATDFKRNIEVVLKFIHPAYLPTPPHFKRFTDGMEGLVDSIHSQSATLLDVGQLNGHVYVSYEYVEGGSLAELLNFRLKSHQLFTLHEIYPILKETAAALIESPVAIHGALCPKNIFIQSGSIQVLDCGLIANLPEAVVGYRLASTSKRRRYVAPEIIAGDGPSTRSDVYSLGVILGEMLTLKRYNGQSNMFGEVLNELNPNVDEVLQNALAENKRDRYKDVEVFLNALADAGGLPIPRFQRLWTTTDDSIIEDMTHMQEDKTAQIVMKDVIQQHYEEVTSVGRNPLFNESSSAPPLPKPSSHEPPPKSGNALPQPGKSLPRPTSSSSVGLPKPSVTPAPVPRPSEHNEPAAVSSHLPPPPRPSMTPLPDEGSEVFALDEYELTPPPDDDDNIQSIEVDDLQLEEVSEITSLSDFDDLDAEIAPIAEPDGPSSAAEDVLPRFARAAQALDAEKQHKDTNSGAEKERVLDDINPRFLRAAQKLSSNAYNTAEPKTDDQSLFSDEEDWRDRIANETSSNEESMISFLAPPPEKKRSSSIPVPAAPRVARASSESPIKISAPPPPPPPPAKKP